MTFLFDAGMGHRYCTDDWQKRKEPGNGLLKKDTRCFLLVSLAYPATFLPQETVKRVTISRLPLRKRPIWTTLHVNRVRKKMLVDT